MKKALITITSLITMAIVIKKVRELELKIDELDKGVEIDPKKVSEMMSTLRHRRERFTH